MAPSPTNKQNISSGPSSSSSSSQSCLEPTNQPTQAKQASKQGKPKTVCGTNSHKQDSFVRRTTAAKKNKFVKPPTYYSTVVFYRVFGELAVLVFFSIFLYILRVQYLFVVHCVSNPMCTTTTHTQSVSEHNH